MSDSPSTSLFKLNLGCVPTSAEQSNHRREFKVSANSWLSVSHVYCSSLFIPVREVHDFSVRNSREVNTVTTLINLVCTHTHIHTYKHPYSTYLHTHTHACTHAPSQHTHTSTLAHTHQNTGTHINKHIHMYKHCKSILDSPFELEAWNVCARPWQTAPGHLFM